MQHNARLRQIRLHQYSYCSGPIAQYYINGPRCCNGADCNRQANVQTCVPGYLELSQVKAAVCGWSERHAVTINDITAMILHPCDIFRMKLR
jgi:hypothetical protein